MHRMSFTLETLPRYYQPLYSTRWPTCRTRTVSVFDAWETHMAEH